MGIEPWPGAPMLETPVGPVVGRRVGGGVWHFGGVPYARAPRFGAPEERSWTEPFDATAPGPAPLQTVGGLDLVPDMVPAETSEDCLRAEIWSGDLSARRPVVVWVPGGSFRVGGASLATYSGASLAAEHDLVVVGVNYRLGVLGWLAADGVPTNLGLRDLLAAVAWLRRVAPAFGGDPDRIVLMGESAGAGAIAHLLAAAPDLPVSGAILQSGAPGSTLSSAAATWVGERVLETAGVRSVEGLRALPPAALLAAQDQAVTAALAKVGMMPLHPWIDDDLLTVSPAHASLAPVPLIVGSTADEMELFRDQVPALPPEVAGRFLAGKGGPLGVTPEGAVAGLAACGDDLVTAVADIDIHLPNELIARRHTAPVYRYRFGWAAAGRGACHALDLPFTFGTLDVAGWREFAGADDPAADVLSSRMRQAWASFAHEGAPSCEPCGAWPADDLVQLGREVTVGPDTIATRLGVWAGGDEKVGQRGV